MFLLIAGSDRFLQKSQPQDLVAKRITIDPKFLLFYLSLNYITSYEIKRISFDPLKT